MLAFTLPPDAARTHGFVARAKQTNVSAIVVADSPLSEITDIQDAVLYAPTTGTGSLNAVRSNKPTVGGTPQGKGGRT